MFTAAGIFRKSGFVSPDVDTQVYRNTGMFQKQQQEEIARQGRGVVVKGLSVGEKTTTHFLCRCIPPGCATKIRGRPYRSKLLKRKRVLPGMKELQVNPHIRFVAAACARCGSFDF